MKRAKQILSLSVFLIMIWPLLSFARTVNLPKTGQTTVHATGDDGDIQAGVAWPFPRFVDNGDGTVTDHLTGLMWLKDASCLGQRNWQGALDVVAALNANPGNYSCSDYTANYGDWRLPNVVELESLVNVVESNPVAWLNTQGFSSVQWWSYWSATNRAYNTWSGWFLQLYSGRVSTALKSFTAYVWPVRDGAEAGPAQTWQTGQTTCYANGTMIDCTGTGQDGEYQKGVPWPSPRFVDNGDGTVTDNLTGLVWLKNANCGGSMNWNDALAYCNNLASGSCGLTDGSVAGDWRLPNRKELFSLIDCSRYWPALPQDAPFINVQSLYYWSATTVYYVTSAWHVHMGSGGVGRWDKSTNSVYVWPVRGGIIYVDVDNISGVEDGSASNPFNTIQEGIDFAGRGDIVQVANGTYTGAGNKNLDFGGKAITVQSLNGPANCTIDCQDDGRGFFFHSDEGEDSRVYGFTITNGSAQLGGGIYCIYSYPTITNCIITGNWATYDGGGVYCETSEPLIINSTIANNEASHNGGGLYFISFSSPIVTNCTIAGNWANGFGGGIYCEDSDPIITNSILWGAYLRKSM